MGKEPARLVHFIQENLKNGTRLQSSARRLPFQNGQGGSETSRDETICKGGKVIPKHCPHSHPLSGENLRFTTNGTWYCRTCHRDAERRRRARDYQPPEQRFRAPATIITEAECRECKVVFPVEHFPRRNDSRSGIHRICQRCRYQKYKPLIRHEDALKKALRNISYRKRFPERHAALAVRWLCVRHHNDFHHNAKS